MHLDTEGLRPFYKLAVGMFQAAPGIVYLNQLHDASEAGFTTTQIYIAVANSTAFQSQSFAFSDAAPNDVFAAAFVENVVGDTVVAEKKAEAATFLESLLNGGMHRGEVMEIALNALDNVSNDHPVWGEAASLFDNQIDASIFYTEVLNGDETVIGELQDTIVLVTSDPASVAVQNDANAGASGDVFQLTQDADVVDGTAGDDTIVGFIGENSNGDDISTLNDFDDINGSGGRDTLNLTVNENTFTAPAMTNVEIISVRATDFSSASIDFSSITGVDTIELKNSPSTYSGFFGYYVADEITTYMFTNVANNTTTATIDLEFLNSTFAGDADAVTVIVENSGDKANDFDVNLNLENADGEDVIEQYDVVSLGTNDNNQLSLNDTEVATRITVTGDNDMFLDVDDVDAMEEIDASAFTGNFELEIDDSEQREIVVKLGSGDDTADLSNDNDYIVTGGAGDDRLVFGSEFNLDDSMDGGDGVDTVSVNNSVVFDANALTADADIDAFSGAFVNMEVLEVTGTATQDIDVSLFGGVQNVQFTDNAFVTIGGGVESGFTLGLGAFLTSTVTVDMDGADTGDADVLNVEVHANFFSIPIVDAADVEILNIVVDDKDGDDSADTGMFFVSLLDDVETINISGEIEGTMTLSWDADTASTIDASAFEGHLLANASGYTDAITLIGGGGDDTFTGGAGQDIVTGGDGDDTYNVVAPSSGVAFDTFTDFQSDDTLFFATADAFNSDAIVLGDVAVFQDYLDAATSLSVSDNDLSWFQFDGNTFVVQAVDEVANTFQNGTDISVKLTGLIDLSDAAFAGGGLTL
jgi:hypothetical protein